MIVDQAFSVHVLRTKVKDAMCLISLIMVVHMAHKKILDIFFTLTQRI